MHIALWILQVLLGLLFVWAGGFSWWCRSQR